MKRCRYFLSVLLTFAMVFTMSFSSFAAGNEVTITRSPASSSNHQAVAVETQYTAKLKVVGSGTAKYKYTENNTSKSLAKGEEGTFTLSPGKGYAFQKITVTDSDTKDRLLMSFTKSGNDYTFKMPAKNILITVTYKYAGGSTTPTPSGSGNNKSGQNKTTTQKGVGSISIRNRRSQNTIREDGSTSKATTTEHKIAKEDTENTKEDKDKEKTETTNSEAVSETTNTEASSTEEGTTTQDVVETTQEQVVQEQSQDTALNAGTTGDQNYLTDSSDPKETDVATGGNSLTTISSSTRTSISRMASSETNKRTAAGESCTITPYAEKIYYGRWSTERFDVATSSGVSRGYCLQPNSAPPRGTFTVSVLNNDRVKMALMFGENGPYAAEAPNLFSGTTGLQTYAFLHAMVSIEYSGQTTGLTATQVANIRKALDIQMSQPARIAEMKNYVVYVAKNSKQDIAWLEKIPRSPSITTRAYDIDTNGHNSVADEYVCINDVVSYRDLEVGQTYFLTGALIDKATGQYLADANGKQIIGTSEFVAYSSDSTELISLKFNGTNLAGKNVVVYETLSQGSNIIAEHKDINDANQSISFPPRNPSIGTTATDGENGTHNSVADGTVTINDTVSYKDLIPGNSYDLTGSLIDKATGKIVTDINGKNVMATKTFKADSANGSTVLTFKFNGSNLGGKNVVVYETMSQGSTIIAEHKDINDGGQTITFTPKNPSVGTTAVDSATNSHYSYADGSVTINDTVSYKDLNEGAKYTVTGTLMDKATGQAVKDADGKTVTATADFTASGNNGTTVVQFKFNGSNLKGKDVVAFETISQGGKVITEHKDINDGGQTIHFPSVGTTATDSDTGNHYSYADGSVTINDSVKYTNLAVGTSYTVKGTLMDKSTGKAAVDAAGKAITAETTFKPTATSGTVNVQFKFDGSKLAGKDVVVFESLYAGSEIIGEHKDINDGGQTIHFPEIGTTAKDSATGTDISYADGSVTINDTVSYKNLAVGSTYVVKGTLMDKSTGKAAVDAAGKTITAETTFKPTAASGSVNVQFKFDGSKFAGKDVVAFETLTCEGKVVAEHKDIDDGGQTVHFPEIGTTAKDSATGIGYSFADGSVTINDTVSYKNLVAGKTYTVKGTLMDKSTGKAAVDAAGKAITAETTFKPTAANGSANVQFKFDGSKLAGKDVVAFETLYLGSEVIAKHEDLNDGGQTVHFPEIGTTAKDSDTKDNYACADGSVTIDDTVSYKNLAVGTTYTVKGILMDKETGKAAVDAQGKQITSEATFKPTATNGTVNVQFKFDATNLKGKDVVVFETLYLGSEILAEHKDIKDEGQTIHFPKIKTTNIDDVGNHVTEATKAMILYDTINYVNLKPGIEYTVSGVLMNKTTGKPALDSNGDEIRSTLKFTPTSPNGSIKMTYSFYGADMKGTVLVAYETITHDGKDFAKHEDINDVDQTVYVPKIGTTATNVDTGDHLAEAKDKVTIKDVVKYEDLLPNRTYTMTGTLMNKETGDALKDKDGKEITVSKEFTPTTTSGSVELEFTIDATELEGVTIVAFEDLSDGKGVYFATHMDFNDEAQSIHIPKIRTVAKNEATDVNIVSAETGEPVTVIDTVKYENLIPGKEYTVSGTLMDKETEEPVKDAEGKEITSTTKFTPEKADGEVEVKFTFDADEFAGKTFVAFEKLFLDDKEYAKHEEITDADQSIYFPQIATTIEDKVTNTNVSKLDKQMTIVDHVQYEGLKPGVEYTLKAKLMDKETEKVVKDAQGNEVTAEKKFTPTESSGTVDVEFTFDGSNLGGHTVVAFEDLQHKDVSYATHADIKDEAQTLYVPEIATTLTTEEDNSHVAEPSNKLTLIDHVTYKNLKVGETYTITGKLMDKKTGKVAKDSKGNEITASKTFVPETINGSVDMTFTFDASEMDDITLVAFEEIGQGGKVFAAHEDINDAQQTVNIKAPDKQGEIEPSSTTEENQYQPGDDVTDNYGAGGGSGTGTNYGSTPQTGDSAMNFALIGVFAVLALGGAAVTVYKKKRS